MASGLGGTQVSPESLDSAEKCAAFLRGAYDHVRLYKDLIEAHAWGNLLEMNVSQLVQLPLGNCPDFLPDEFKHFIRMSQRYQLDPNPRSAADTPPCHVRHFLGTSAKKRDEMLKMANLIANISENLGVRHIVDIGCGKGYLSTLLASAYKLSVLGIEQSEDTASAANERNELVKKRLPKGDTLFDFKVRAARIRLRNEPESKSLSSILDEEHIDATILVGLHICGDLLPDCLKLFSECSHLKGGVLCGCCYNMLTETSESDTTSSPARFPLSTFAKAHNVTFGRRLRNAACHSVFEWSHDPDALLERITFTSCYRAVLGLFMHQRGLRTTVKWGRTFQNVKRKPQFGVWAADLLAVHCGHEGLPTSAELEAFYQAASADCLKRFMVLECVVGALQPVLESIVVVDRMLYAWEQGLVVSAVALFPPRLSPRTFVLTVRR